MILIISGQNIALGKCLHDYVEHNLPGHILRYLPNSTSAHIIFKKIKNRFKCEIIIYDGTGKAHSIIAKKVTYNAYDAFNQALAAVSRQARHTKSKMSDRHHIKRFGELNKVKILGGY